MHLDGYVNFSFLPTLLKKKKKGEKSYCVISLLRLYNGRIRQGALHCLLAVVKGLEKRTLYGYWSSLIPDTPIGGPPPLTLITIILKDPSPKVQLALTRRSAPRRVRPWQLARPSPPPGARVCASGVVGHSGRLPSVSGRGRRYGRPSEILHAVLLLAGRCRQRTAPRSHSGAAGRDLPPDAHAGHKGTMTCTAVLLSREV